MHDRSIIDKSSFELNKPVTDIKLGKIRRLMHLYKKDKSSIQRFLFGDEDEINQIASYLKQYSDKSNDYILSSHDLFKLINIIKIKSDLKLFQALKEMLESLYLFKTIAVLDKYKLNNPTNYLKSYQLRPQWRYIFYNLFGGLTPFHPGLVQATIDTFIEFNRANISVDFTRCCLILLVKNNLLNSKNLNLLINKKQNVNALFGLMSKLVKYKNLRQRDCDLMYPVDVSLLQDMIDLTIKANILDDDVFEKICLFGCKNNDFFTISTMLSKAECMTKKALMKMSNINPFFLNTLSHVAMILQKYSLFDEKSFEMACSRIQEPHFLDILEELEKAELLDKNIIQQLPKNEENFYKVLEYVNKAGILKTNKQFIKDILKIFNDKDDDDLQELVKAFNSADFMIDAANLRIILKENDISYITKLFTPLAKNNLADNNNLNVLLTMTYANYDRAKRLIRDLSNANLLDAVSFGETINLVTAKLPPVTESKVVKNSRKAPGAPSKSEFIVDGKIHLFAQHRPDKKYLGGGFGLVKKAFNAPTHGKLKYAIKKLKDNDINEAKREVSYHRLLGRKAYHFFRNGKRYVVSPWQFGKNLDDCTQSELTGQLMEQRLKWIISGLVQLNALHRCYRLHGDVKPLNFILSIKKARLRLIDFGGARKRDTHKSFAYTSDFLSKNSSQITSAKYDFWDDVYSMGIVIASIFPELFSINDQNRVRVTPVKTTGLTPLEKGIKNLVDSMMHQKDTMRCSVDDALNYCQELLGKKSILNDHILKIISDSTIQHPLITVNDITHGVTRIV